MPIKSNHLDTHHLYAHFLDALEAGSSPDDIANVVTNALNQAKTSYEATLRQAQQKEEKEAAIDSLLASMRECDSAFGIPLLASDTSDATKKKLFTFMETLRSIFDLASTADKEEEEGKEESSSEDILRSFISTLI